MPCNGIESKYNDEELSTYQHQDAAFNILRAHMVINHQLYEQTKKMTHDVAVKQEPCTAANHLLLSLIIFSCSRVQSTHRHIKDEHRYWKIHINI